MDVLQTTTVQNLVVTFGSTAMVSRKYLFFADVVQRLGYTEVAQLFRTIAEQEATHAFTHFALLYPELVGDDCTTLSEAKKKTIVAQCLAIAIESETYESTQIYPEFAEMAIEEGEQVAAAAFQDHATESAAHAQMFRQAADRLGLGCEAP
jgi:rubrerythrin